MSRIEPRREICDQALANGDRNAWRQALGFPPDPRLVNCEACQTEGRILTNDGGPDDVDHGVCPECGGARVVEIETQPIEMADLDHNEESQTMICPVSGSYCMGDLSHLCLDYGCARKVGESPHSEFEQDDHL